MSKTESDNRYIKSKGTDISYILLMSSAAILQQNPLPQNVKYINDKRANLSMHTSYLIPNGNVTIN